MSKGIGRILVAEDEQLIRTMMVDVLRDAGYEVLEATNGLEAIRLLAEFDHVSAVVTDIYMPVLDGIDVAHEVHARHPQIPVIFASAWADSIDLPQSCRCLLKPYTTRALLHEVEAALV